MGLPNVAARGYPCRMKRTLLIIPALVFLLTGCASGNDAATAPTPSATAEEAKLPPVSLQTTCTFLYGSNLDGPLSHGTDIITRFVEQSDGSTITVEELEETIDAIQSALDHAGPDVAPFIEAQLSPLDALLNAKVGGENTTIKLGDWKASGIELLNQCRQYL